jgi:hypothetical protein
VCACVSSCVWVMFGRSMRQYLVNIARHRSAAHKRERSRYMRAEMVRDGITFVDDSECAHCAAASADNVCMSRSHTHIYVCICESW